MPACQVADVKVHTNTHLIRCHFELVDGPYGHRDIWVIEISPCVLFCHQTIHQSSVQLFKSIARWFLILSLPTSVLLISKREPKSTTKYQKSTNKDFPVWLILPPMTDPWGQMAPVPDNPLPLLNLVIILSTGSREATIFVDN